MLEHPALVLPVEASLVQSARALWHHRGWAGGATAVLCRHGAGPALIPVVELADALCDDKLPDPRSLLAPRLEELDFSQNIAFANSAIED